MTTSCFVSKLIQNDAGRVIGLIDQGDRGREVVPAELDTAALTWTTMGDLPSVLAPWHRRPRCVATISGWARTPF